MLNQANSVLATAPDMANQIAWLSKISAAFYKSLSVQALLPVAAMTSYNNHLPPGAFDPRLFPSPSLPPTYPIMQPYVTVVRVNRHRRPTCIRFLQAFAIAVLIWFLCAAFFSTFHMVHYHPRWVSLIVRSLSYSSLISWNDIIRT